MAETNKHNPNQPNYTARRLAVGAGAGMLLLGAAAGGNVYVNHVKEANHLQDQLTNGHAYENYQNGEIKKGDVVVIKVKDAGNGNADNLAIRINREGTAMKDLSGEIAPQVDAQGYPGVEQGEVLVLDKDLVDPKIAENWALTPEEETPEPTVIDDSGLRP